MQRTRPEGALRALAAITAGVAALLAVPALGDPPPVAAAASALVTGGPLSPPHALVLASTAAVLARGVLLGRRAAWYGLLVLVALGAVAVLAREDPPWRLPLLGAAAAALWRLRDGFPVRPHPDRVRAAVRTGAVLVIGAAAGAVLVGGVSIRSVGHDVAVGLGAMGSPLDGASWLPGALAVTGGAGLLLILLTLLAAAPAPPPGAEDERRRVARLVAHPGSDTLAPFALRRDKSYVFSPDGRAAIGYRVLFGVAVAGGDPVGDPASYEAAVARFLALCRRTGWRPAVLGAGADRLPLWAPLRSFGFGDEVVIRTAEFGLRGRSMRNVRQAVQRTRNAGVTTRILREGDLAPDLREALRRVAARALGGAAERGFSMNLDELLTGYHADALIAVARDRAGEPVAFQRYLISGSGLSLDAMRRAPGAPNGVNERLIVEVVGYARRHGVAEVSLNFAAFRELLESAERGLAERVGYRALHLLDPWIAVESLYLFDRKFRPAYRPRSIVFRSWWDIARLAAALLTLEFGRTRPAPAPEEPLPRAAGLPQRP